MHTRVSGRRAVRCKINPWGAEVTRKETFLIAGSVCVARWTLCEAYLDVEGLG